MAIDNLTHTGSSLALLHLLAATGLRVFTITQARDLIPQAGLAEGYLRQALHHLTKAGWLVRLRNGLYTLASSAPGASPAHEFEVAMALVKPAAISHWSALHYHHLTEQVPRKVFVLTTTDASVPRLRGHRAKTKKGQNGYPAGDALYQFIQVKPERFFGTEKIWIGEARVTITDPERTLIDGLSMPQHFGDFAEVLHAFEERRQDLDVERIIEYALKLDAATAKRLGWVLERQDVALDILRPLVKLEVKGYRTLDPTGPRKGPCHKHWMIQENLPGMVSS